MAAGGNNSNGYQSPGVRKSWTITPEGLADSGEVAGGNASYWRQQQTGPYRGGLETNFDYSPSVFADGSADGNKIGYRQGWGQDTDSDVRTAANLAWEMAHPNAGSSQDDLRARLNMYKGRIGMKNSLAEQIANNARMEKEGEDVDKLSAGQALGEGLKNTRQNYNSRGLLYSGMRQGGENQVKGAVAGQLASGLAGTKRDSANSLTAAQNAYASVDLANQQESLQLAHQAFDTASANNIARLQAMQQLGAGIGGLAGIISGSYYNRPSTTVPTSGGGHYESTSSDGRQRRSNYFD